MWLFHIICLWNTYNMYIRYIKYDWLLHKICLNNSILALSRAFEQRRGSTRRRWNRKRASVRKQCSMGPSEFGDRSRHPSWRAARYHAGGCTTPFGCNRLQNFGISARIQKIEWQWEGRTHFYQGIRAKVLSSGEIMLILSLFGFKISITVTFIMILIFYVSIIKVVVHSLENEARTKQCPSMRNASE